MGFTWTSSLTTMNSKINHNSRVLLWTRYKVASLEYELYLKASHLNEPDFLNSLSQMAEEGHEGARLYYYVGKNKELLNRILDDSLER